MVIELENLFRNEGDRIPLEYSLDFSNREWNGEKAFVSPVMVTGEIRNKSGIVSMEAMVRFTYQAPCDRCAASVSRQMEIPLSHLLVNALNEEDNDEFLLLESMRLDLETFVWEDIVLEFPSKFLCRSDCQGICPICGRNLNDSPCSCQKPIDPRLEALRQLLDK